jgi:hypothetical protein
MQSSFRVRGHNDLVHLIWASAFCISISANTTNFLLARASWCTVSDVSRQFNAEINVAYQ